MNKKYIKFYVCECGEDVYEDDAVCICCGKKTDKKKFKNHELIKIIKEENVEVVEMSLMRGIRS